MQVILTHEHTDFDALASQLGALMLLEDARAILPKTLNRNVREFVRLYGTELAFIQANALPKSSISAITLVDTQSLVTIKGLNKNIVEYSGG